MKLKILETAFRNFISYGNNLTTLNLDFKSPTLIVGQNHDSVVNGQIDSNGSGKTTILNAICYALYDRAISTTDKNKLINNINKKNLYVSIVFQKDDLYYKVERFRKNKALGGDGVALYVSSDLAFSKENEKTLDSVTNTNKAIESIIGIPFEIFVRIIVFKASHTSFLNLSAADQREITEELFDVTELSKNAEALKEQIKNNKTDLNILELLNSQIVSENERIDKQIASVKAKNAEWVDNHNIVLDSLRQKKAKLFNVDFYAEYEKFKQIVDYTTKINGWSQNQADLIRERTGLTQSKKLFNDWEYNKTDKLNKLIEKQNKLSAVNFTKELQQFEKLDEYIDMRSQLVTERHEFLVEEKDSQKIVDSSNAEMAHLESGNCPYCNQIFKDSANKKNELSARIADSTNKLSVIKEQISSLNDDISKIDNRIESLKNGLIYKTKQTLYEDKSAFDSLDTQITDMRDSINPYTDVADYDNTILQLENKLKNIENDITQYKTYLTNINNSLNYSSEKELIILETEFNNLDNVIAQKEQETNPYLSMIDELINEPKKENKSKEIELLYNELEHQEFLLKLLTKKDSFIRKALLSKNINLTNNRLKYYLTKIGLPHRVAFTEEMNVVISQFKNEVPYEMLSDGQRARVNLALSFAFRDILQSKFGAIDFCILDECLDVGLGNVGVQLAAKMIKQIATENKMSMFIISHRDEVMNMFDDRLTVEMRNGISNITSGKMLLDPINEKSLD